MKELREILEHFPDKPRFQSLASLEEICDSAFVHGDAEKWTRLLEKFPKVENIEFNLNSPVVELYSQNNPGIDSETMRNLLMGFHPWRKGPYKIFGTAIDTEWRSDLKWDRLKAHIEPLDGRVVLDVGCGNGYHCWRMLGENAAAVIGLEPYLLSVFQFRIFKKYIQELPVWILPLKLEQFIKEVKLFDTVFSMGVLYHQRSPFEHLAQLKGALRKNGELILETLVIEGKNGEVFVPEGRYAKMRNVWFIPSPPTMESWLKRAGFSEIKLIDVTRTTFEEQRKTDWMTYESLADFLDPKNNKLTIEGCPAPVRAIFSAKC